MGLGLCLSGFLLRSCHASDGGVFHSKQLFQANLVSLVRVRWRFGGKKVAEEQEQESPTEQGKGKSR